MIRRLFRRPRAARVLPEAELARRLTDPDYVCACCGTVLNASHAVWPDAPFGWKNPPAPISDANFDSGGREVLTETLARRDKEFLLRAELPLPVLGTDGHVTLGVWCSLRSGNHARFRSGQARGDAERLGEMSSLLYTRIPPQTGPLLTEGVIMPRAGGRLPLYRITANKHPLHAAQDEGLAATEILALYEEFGQGDLLAHLKA